MRGMQVYTVRRMSLPSTPHVHLCSPHAHLPSPIPIKTHHVTQLATNKNYPSPPQRMQEEAARLVEESRPWADPKSLKAHFAGVDHVQLRF